METTTLTTTNTPSIRTVHGSPFVAWGETKLDGLAMCNLLTNIQETSKIARDATSYGPALDEYQSAMRGHAVMLGVVLASDQDPIEAVRAYLIASRDHEGAEGEREYRTGNKDLSRVHTARRGYLDGTAYEIDRALKCLNELKDYEQKRAAKKV